MIEIFNWFYSSNRKEQLSKKYFVKYLYYGIILVLIISDYFYGTLKLIKELLDYKFIKYSSLIIKILLDWFTIFAVISFILLAISFIFSLLIDYLEEKFYYLSINDNYSIIKNSIFRGAEYHFRECIENITILLITSYIVDFNIFLQYKNRYSDEFWIIICSFMILEFIFGSLVTIFNRVFRL